MLFPGATENSAGLSVTVGASDPPAHNRTSAAFLPISVEDMIDCFFFIVFFN
jgi:hypothetical protein